jgi:hypothetical protein
MNRVIRDDTRRNGPNEHARRAAQRTFELSDRRGPDRRLQLLLGAGIVLAAAGAAVVYARVASPSIDATYSAAGTDRPAIMVPREIVPSSPGFVNTLRGLTDRATALTANGEPVPIDAGGGFAVNIPQAWTEIRLVAADAGGNQTEAVVTVTANPTPTTHPPTVAVHVTATGWADPVVHQQVLDMIAAGRINAVELDIKDEVGEVGYASAVPLATTTGAARGHYDARQALDELHGHGVRVIGRVVNFLDPVLAGWAWQNGRPDMIVLDAAGEPLANNYGTAAFTNFAHPEVRQYQIDLAKEAVALGFDEILYDYVRRPEGDMAAMQFPGLTMPPEVAVARFVADTRAQLQGTDALLGVSVFGISASRPEPTAQDIGLLAPNVDYVSPMVYPSHWGSGEYGVPDPVRQPAEIVTASLSDFERLVAGSGAAVVPWLQDFDSGSVIYGPAEVRAQIDAARATGSDGFLLWNPNSLYTADALDPLS